MAIDTESLQWAAGISAGVAAFMLKHLHGKISEGANKQELAEAMRVVAAQRMEDIHRIEQYQQERRQTENAIFERMRSQEEMLARIDERTARMDLP